MLDGVNGPLSESRLAVGQFHAHIEGGDHLAAHLVLAAYIDAAVKTCMVNGKTWYLVHCCVNVKCW